MSCTVCGEAFSTKNRPHVLPCGHTFCMLCLEKLHRQNIGIIQCPDCRGETHFETVDRIPINHWAENHISSLLRQETQDHPLSESYKGSQFDQCPVHGHPMSCWCRTCHISICSDCKQLHVAQKDSVFDYQQAKDLLLSEYRNRSRPFMDWLKKVETVTKETLEITESVVPVLMQTLSIIQDYRSQMKEQDQDMNEASSPEVMEALLEKSSKWCKRRKPTARQQIDKVLVAFSRIQSSISDVQKLQTELESKLFEAGETASLLSTSLGETISIASTMTSELEASPDREELKMQYTIVAVTGALPRPLQGFGCDAVSVRLPEYHAGSYATHLTLKSESGRPRCIVCYLTNDDRTLFSVIIREKIMELCPYNHRTGQNSPTEKGKARDVYNIEMTIVEDDFGYKVEWGDLKLECKKIDYTYECRKIEVRGFNDEELRALFVTNHG